MCVRFRSSIVVPFLGGLEVNFSLLMIKAMPCGNFFISYEKTLQFFSLVLSGCTTPKLNLTGRGATEWLMLYGSKHSTEIFSPFRPSTVIFFLSSSLNSVIVNNCLHNYTVIN